MSAFWKWLGDWLLGTFVEKLLAALGAVIAAGRRDQANRDAGAAEAIIEGQKKESADLKRAQDAIDEADRKPIEYRD